MDQSIPGHASGSLLSARAWESTAQPGPHAHPRWYLWSVIAVLTALPVAFLLLAPFALGNKTPAVALGGLGLGLLMGIVSAVLLSRRLLADNAKVTHRTRLLLLSLVAGFELSIWPGVWVFMFPADPAEKNLWRIAAPQASAVDFTGQWDVLSYTGLTDVPFEMDLRQRPDDGTLEGILTTPVNIHGNFDKWVLADSAVSGNELRLHFRPAFPYFWYPGITLVGTVSESGPNKVATLIDGDYHLHLRSRASWKTGLRATRK